MKSNHNLGADITYKLIDSSIGRYRFTVSLYRNCGGIQFTNEVLEIRKSGFSGSVPMTLTYREEVTPMCKVPDVATNPITNCTSVGNYYGMERCVFQVDYTIGKNIGWAYVGWQSCCRSSSINSISSAGSNSMWIQAAFNTDYVNHSPVFTTEPIPYWCRLRESSYNIGAVDSFDAKYISINGKSVLKDSFQFQLYAPFTSESPTSNIFNGNPTILYNSSLYPTNFLYTTNGVNFNPYNGSITCIPSITQDAVMAMAVSEYRAVPNPNGIGYTRVKIGYVARDIQFTVRDVCDNLTNFSLIKDSSNVDTLLSNTEANTCASIGNKLMLKVVGPVGQYLKIKDKSYIDTSLIKNYQVSVQTNRVGNTDTSYIKILFDKTVSIKDYRFLFKAYYCSSTGYSMDRFIPITINFKSDVVSFQEDTIYTCLGGNLVRLGAYNATQLSWTPQTGIVSATSDSSWIYVAPNTSRMYYANNLASNAICKINDSVFVKVDSCASISGFVFLDVNKNCVKDTLEPILDSQAISIFAQSSGYQASLLTNSAGHYTVFPAANSNYLFKNSNLFFNCSASPSEYPTSIGFTAISKDIPVKDTCVVSNFQSIILQNEACIDDSFKVKINFYKTFGNLKAKIFYGDGDSTMLNWGVHSGNNSQIFSHKYHTTNSFTITIKWYDIDNHLLSTNTINGIKISSCIEGLVFYDMDTTCIYNSTKDTLCRNCHIKVKNLSNSATRSYFSDVNGKFVSPIDLNTNYEIECFEILNCNGGLRKINMPAFTNDTFLKRNIAIRADSMNSTLILNRVGSVSNTGYLNIKLNKSTYNIIGNIPTSYVVTLPAKCSYLYSSSNATTTQAGSQLFVNTNSPNSVDVYLKFDSLISTDTLCFHVKLNKLLNESNLSDNEITFCAPANTSYDPNNKLVAINSNISPNKFTNREDYISYTINFQNTGNAVARDIYLTDKIDTRLDLSTLKIIDNSHAMSVTLDDNRMLKFEFKNIMLIDSVTNANESKGFVCFMIKPIDTLNLNETITNTANIYFDFNSLIITNTAISQYVKIDTIAVIPKYTLSLSVNPANAGNVSGQDSYTKNSIVSINASANTGYIFKDWTENGIFISNSTQFSFPMQKDRNLVANFIANTSSVHQGYIPEFSISPIPAKDILYVNSLYPFKQFKIKLYSIEGKLLRQLENTKSIDISNLVKGFYILKLSTAENTQEFKIQKE